MRRQANRTRSSRARRIQAVQDIIRDILKIRHGAKCQFCGRKEDLGVFHILPVGLYPKIRFFMQNVLLSCWKPCHYTWHHDPHQADRFKAKIAALKGFKTFAELRDTLLIYDKSAPTLTAFQIGLVEAANREQLKEMENVG